MPRRIRFRSQLFVALLGLSVLAAPVLAQAGDVNDDGQTDLADALELCKMLGGNRSVARPERADYNHDGRVDQADRQVALRLSIFCEGQNTRPVAVAGRDTRVSTGTTIELDGSKSFDLDGDSLVYTWSLLSKPPGASVFLSSSSAVRPTLSLDLEGDYVVQLIVNDGVSDSIASTVMLSTVDATPTADAGPDQTVPLSSVVQLDGTGSSDDAGSPAQYAWRFLSAPFASSTILDDGTIASPTFTADAPGTYLLELVVSDDTFVSEPDTVLISTENSAPVADAGPEQIVVLDATAVLDGAGSSDPDGDSFSYSWAILHAPPDSSAGLDDPTAVTPSFVADREGIYVLQLIVDDGLAIGSPPDTVVVRVSDSLVTVPDLVGLDEIPAKDLLRDLGLSVGVVQRLPDPVQPAGQVLLQAPTAGALVASGSDVDLVVSDGPDADAPVVTITLDPEQIGVGESTTVTVSATDNVAVTGLGLTIGGQATPLDGNNQAVYVATQVGPVPVVATAQDGDGNVSMATANIAVTDASDVAPPFVAIESPSDLTEITFLTDVVGTVSDANLVSYDLAIGRLSSPDLTVVATGTAEVASGVLATFDPTLLENGLYRVRLTARDVNGATASDERVYKVEGRAKVGNLRLSFIDLAVPLSGIPITVVRTYDSRVKTQEDFGVGWKLEIRRGTLERRNVPGDGWQILPAGGFFPFPCVNVIESKPHLTELRLSDQEVYRFRTALSNTFPIVGGCSADAGFEFVDGNLPNATLQPIGSAQVVWRPGTTEVVDALEQPWDPQAVRLFLPDGRTFDFTGGKVTRFADSHGNAVFIDDNGVTHTSGVGVNFARDGQGRITSITDPMGNVLGYAYDGQGDLVAFTDAESAVTTFAYDDDHNLTRAIDALGNDAALAEYDTTGRLVAISNALGDRTRFVHDLNGQQEVVVNARGFATTVNYDPAGNITSQTTPVTIEGQLVQATTTYAYDSDDNERYVEDPDGHVIERTFDIAGNPLSTTVDPGGLTITSLFEYNAAGDVTVQTDPHGRIDLLEYDPADNDLEQWTDHAGAVTTFQHDSGGNLIMREDDSGNVFVYDYDNGRVTRRTDELGGVIEYGYDDNGNRTFETVYRIVDSVLTPFATFFEYDDANRLTRTTDALGNPSRIEYNALGLVSARIDELDRRTEFGYDAVGNLTQILFPDGTEVLRTYDASGNLISETDQQDRVTDHEYDGLNRRTRTIDPDSTDRRTVYSPGGLVVAEIDELGNRTDFTYRADGRLESMIAPEVTDDTTGLPVRPTTTFEYDTGGRQTAIIDPRGERYELEYDDQARTVLVRNPDLTTNLTVLDRFGRTMAITDEEGRTVTFAYLGTGDRLESVTLPPPDIGDPSPVTRYEYDEAGNRTAQIDALNRRTEFRYDSLNRLERVTLPGLAERTLAYDEVGNLESWTNYDGRTVSFQYDSMNRLESRELPGNLITLFTYTPTGLRKTVTDAAGLTAYGYDDRDRLVSVSRPDTGTVSYMRDDRGSVVTATGPSIQVSRTHDAMGRLTSVSGTSGEGGALYGYDASGNLTSMTLANGVSGILVRDARGRVESVTYGLGATAIASMSYQYDLAGRRTQMTELNGSVEDYGYDALGRLVTETRTGTDPHTRVYEYNPVGNRTRAVFDGNEILYTYNDDDELLSADAVGFTYDDAGNLSQRIDGASTTAYTWSADGRLTDLNADGQVTSYAYDADGLRVARQTPGGTSRQLLDYASPNGYPQVLEDQDASGLAQSVFVHGFGPVAATTGGVTHHFLIDAHGSARALTSGAGAITDRYTYDGFGARTVSTGSTGNPYGYSGEWTDPESDAIYLRARYYDPGTGRFLSKDPASGDVQRPASLHDYVYAENSPINVIDPSGESIITEFLVTQAVKGNLRGFNAAQVASVYCNFKGAGAALAILLAVKQVQDSSVFFTVGGKLDLANDALGADTKVSFPIAFGYQNTREDLSAEQLKKVMFKYATLIPPGIALEAALAFGGGAGAKGGLVKEAGKDVIFLGEFEQEILKTSIKYCGVVKVGEAGLKGKFGVQTSLSRSAKVGIGFELFASLPGFEVVFPLFELPPKKGTVAYELFNSR